MSRNKALKKRNADPNERYERKKNDVLEELRPMAWVPWSQIKETMNSFGLPTLKGVKAVMVEHFPKQGEGTDDRSLFKTNGEHTYAVKKGVNAMLGKSGPEPVKTGSGITIDASSGTGTEMTVGSDAQHTVGPGSGVHTPSPPSPSPSSPSSPSPQQSQSSETSPSDRPKKRKRTYDNGVDTTNQLSSEDEDLKRQKPLHLEPDRAKELYTRLKGNTRLNDDAIHITKLALQYPSTGNPPPTILDTMIFKIDEDEVPRQLKRKELESGEPIYVPLHHQNPEHWTSCVLFFELDPAPTSKVDSIRLNFYDSMENNDRTKKVKTFFTKWIKTHYPDSKFTFEQKETAQQKDTTNCGVFVLETIRRLIASEDVSQPIEPKDAKERFLDMITSMDTSSPSPSADIQVIDKIKALKGTHDASMIMDGSPSINQQPVDIRLSPEFITKIRSLFESEGISIAEQLSLAKTELKRIAEKEEHLRPELTGAREELVLAEANMRAVNAAWAAVSESITMDDATDDLSIGEHLNTAKNEPMSDIDTFRWVMDNAASELIQKKRNRFNDKLAEIAEEERRRAREDVESAKIKVRQLTGRETHLLGEKGQLDADIKIYEGLLYLAPDGGSNQVDENLSTSSVAPSQ